MTDYPVTPLATDPGSSTNPQTGTNMLVGDQSGLDASLRPMWPVAVHHRHQHQSRQPRR